MDVLCVLPAFAHDVSASSADLELAPLGNLRVSSNLAEPPHRWVFNPCNRQLSFDAARTPLEPRNQERMRSERDLPRVRMVEGTNSRSQQQVETTQPARLPSQE